MRSTSLLDFDFSALVAIVDDENDVAISLKRVLNLIGLNNIEVFNSPEELLSSDNLESFAIVYTDLIMENTSGFDLIRIFKNRELTTPIIVVSAFSDVENTVKAIKIGAFDFISKPFNIEVIKDSIYKLVKHQEFNNNAKQGCSLADYSEDKYLSKIIGSSKQTKNLIKKIKLIRDLDASILIEGETGTGKELVAQAIHADKGPFVAVNVSAVSSELLESELFGHIRGSFTGATSNRTGLFEQAQDGTLFLDEINSMPLAMQAKILRALQERKIRPVGSSKEKSINFRVISASNKSLFDSITNNEFRLDLFHRLNVIQVKIPPLRERVEDIGSLANNFLIDYAQKHNKPKISLSSSAISSLEEYSWPGNIRELQNIIERLVIFSNQEIINPDDIYEVLNLSFLPNHSDANEFSAPLDLTLKELEHKYASQVLNNLKGNKTQTAKSLDIDYKTLINKLD